MVIKKLNWIYLVLRASFCKPLGRQKAANDACGGAKVALCVRGRRALQAKESGSFQYLQGLLL